MIECRFCHYPEVKIISSDLYFGGEEVIVECINCGEIFEVTKDDLENESSFD